MEETRAALKVFQNLEEEKRQERQSTAERLLQKKP